MPPPIPSYALDCKRKTRRTGVTETRTNQFFAELHLRGYSRIVAEDMLEFGQVVYGPLRVHEDEAERDLKSFRDSIESGGNIGLRRCIAKMAPSGGTRSSPSPAVVPILSKFPVVSLRLSHSDDSIRITGVRRSNIFVHVDAHAPLRILERAVDLLADLLSSVVDSQLGILPSVDELSDLIKYSFSRNNGPCPVSDSIFQKYIIPLIELFRTTPIWATRLSEPVPGSDDQDVIHGFLSQFLDKARQADMFGEKKQAKRINKKNRSKKLAKHTVYVTNIPKACLEKNLFEVFESGLGDDEKHVYKVVIMRDPRTNKSRGFGRVIFRNAKATKKALEKTDWEVDGRILYLESYVERLSRGNEIDEDEDADESDSGSDFPGLYDFLPSPKKPQRSFQLPQHLEESIREVVARNPKGCALNQLADLVDASRYGFRSIAEAIRSLNGLRVEAQPGKKGAYIVYNVD